MAKKFLKIPNIPNPGKNYPGAPSTITPTPEKAFAVLNAGAFNNIKRKLITYTPNPSDNELGKSLLGTPVYSRLLIRKTFDTTVGNETSGTDYIKFDNAIIIVNQQKNIVTTPIQGRNGTVKEYISDGDYKIDVQAQVIGRYPNQYPQTEVDNLHKLLLEPNEIILDSDFLNILGITYCVVESYEFGQIQGSRGRVEFRMSLMSDYPKEFELGITDNA